MVGRKIKIVLTGLNGYGKNFISVLLKEAYSDRVELVGVVSRNPKMSEHYEHLVKKQIGLYTSLEACLAENEVDLAIIATPMHIHYQEVMCALRHGVHIFCEKPLAPTINECLEIQRLAKEKDKLVAAHFLHNLFFLCGKTMEESAYPISIQGEGYKAHQVEGYDTVFIRMLTEEKQELLYLATLAAKQVKRPRFTMILDKAIVNFPEGVEENIVVHTNWGEEIIYGCPEEGGFEHFLEVAESIQTQKKLLCSAQTTLPQIIGVNAAMAYIPVCDFPKQMIEEDEDQLYVKGLEEVLEQCYKQNKLPNELQIKWSKPSESVCIKGYRSFEGIAE